ncbi:discoidin domain-containing protein [Flavitalea flava]
MKPFFTIFIFVIVIAFFSHAGHAQNVSVVMQHGDQRGTGWNNRETLLNKTNVNAASFGKLFTQAVDDQLYAQPLVVSGLSIGGKKRNVVFAATTNNTVYAFDADSSNGGNFLWKKNYTPAGQRPPTNFDMRNLGACGGGYNDFSHTDGSAANIGIVGSPVIDTLSQTMYFVTRNTNGSVYQQFLHGIDITTGAERSGSPIQITATIPGNGSGSSNGSLPFDPARHNQRTGLVLSQGIVYIAYASHCDNGPYHGWIFGYDAATLAQKIVYNDTPDGYNGGIWMSAAAPAVDENGNLYLGSGNGSVATNGNSRQRSESMLKLSPNLATGTLDLKSFFTPSNFQELENSDLDFGVTEMLLIPNTTQVFTGCKDGTLYLANRDNMGGFNAGSNNVLQTITLGRGRTLRSSLAYFQNSSKEFIYTWSENAALKAFPYSRTTNKLDSPNVITSGIQGPNSANNGVFMSVSSNGTKDSTGILWASHAANGDANQSVRPGILRAIDASNVTKELWNSNQNAKDNLPTYAKFVCPVIANGKVYAATFSNQLIVYGITDTTTHGGSCSGNTDLALNKPAVSSSVESGTYPPSNAFDGNAGTRWASLQGKDPQWIYVDLGTRYNICRVNLTWEAALASNYQIQIADDTAHWNSVTTITGNTAFVNSIFLTGTGRYVRMLGTARGTNWGYSLYSFEVYGTPANTCTTPSGLATSNITPNSATLSWNAIPGVSSYTIQYKTVNAAGFTSATSAGNSLSLATLACSTDYLFKVQAVCSSISQSDFSQTVAFSTGACDNSCGILPTRWSQLDIGAVGLAGQACYNNNTWKIQASGSDIWNNRDQFHFAYKTFSNDGQVTARVDSLDKVNVFNKAGVMFRESTDSGARNAFIAYTSGNGITFQYRSTSAGPSNNINITGYALPYYVKLIKAGTRYSGYISPDSVTWKQIGATVDLGFGAGVSCYAGLAATSHDNTRLSTSRFSQVPIIFSADTTVNTGLPGNCPVTNIALNRPAASSGNLSTNKSIYEFQAFDGKLTTRWASRQGSDNAWIYVDLGKQYTICQVSINWASEYGKNYQIQVSNDAVNWNTIYTMTGNTALINTLPVNGTGRFVRMLGLLRGTSLGYSIYEMTINGTVVPGQPVNLALNRPGFSSGNEDNILVPAAALDGLGNTRWASTSRDPSWIYVDLGNAYAISSVVLDWEASLGADFQIQVSNDALTWRTIRTVTGNTFYSNVLAVSGTGRYVRMYGTRRGTFAGYSIYEMEVYGAAGAVAAAASMVKSAVGMKEMTNMTNITVYPNPSANTINVTSADASITSMEIMSLNGQTIRSLHMNAQRAVTVDISFLHDGVYVLVIHTSTGFFTQKIIKVSGK